MEVFGYFFINSFKIIKVKIFITHIYPDVVPV